MAIATSGRKCARVKRNGDQCGNYACTGQTVCPSHGGKRELARRRRAEVESELKVRRYLGKRAEGVPDPGRVLLEEVARTASIVAWLEDKVAGLASDDQVGWGVTEVVDSSVEGSEGRTTKMSAQMSVWVDMLQRERSHLVKACQVAIQAGLQERQVRVAEAQGALVAGVIRGILGDLLLTQAQWSLVQEVVPRHLRLLKELGDKAMPAQLPGGGRRKVVDVPATRT